MIVVSNTTPILSLYKIERLGLLRSLFDQVMVPRAVYNEVAILGKGKRGHDALDMAEYIIVKDMQNTLAADLLRSQLDYGEAEAIVLAKELGADLLILDEKKARKVAQANRMPVIGTIGVLQAAKDKGLIPDIRTQLDGLIANGIWIDSVLYQSVIRSNNE
jgi:predicted nucleic acid-binding protein